MTDRHGNHTDPVPTRVLELADRHGLTLKRAEELQNGINMMIARAAAATEGSTQMTDVATHTVAITGIDEHPRIEFTCNGGAESACHNYPGCDCESWDDDHHHPKVTHLTCWMQPWFDNDCISPMAAQGALDDCEYKVGMSGPITTEFCRDFVEWEFVPAKPSALPAIVNDPVLSDGD